MLSQLNAVDSRWRQSARGTEADNDEDENKRRSQERCCAAVALQAIFSFVVGVEGNAGSAVWCGVFTIVFTFRFNISIFCLLLSRRGLSSGFVCLVLFRVETS